MLNKGLLVNGSEYFDNDLILENIYFVVLYLSYSFIEIKKRDNVCF